MDINTANCKTGHGSRAIVCSNCNKYLERGEEISTFGTLNVFSNEISKIRVWDFITNVYRITTQSWDDLTGKLNRENHQEHFAIEESLGICRVCVSLLSDIYNTIAKFESLTHESSFMQQVQNICGKILGNCKQAEPLVISVSNSVNSSSSNNEDENLFISFDTEDNYEVGLPFGKPECCFAEEIKSETDNLRQTGSMSLPSLLQEFNSEVDEGHEKIVSKISSKSPKTLVVKIEKLSEEVVSHYQENKRRRINCAKSDNQREPMANSLQSTIMEFSNENGITEVSKEVIDRWAMLTAAASVGPSKDILNYCTGCGKYEPNSQKRAECHQLDRGRQKAFKCPICHKHYSRNDNLTRHINNIHNNKGKKGIFGQHTKL